MIYQDYLTIAHVGDSKACMGKQVGESLRVNVGWLTVDHKPNQRDELQRIQQNGEAYAIYMDINHIWGMSYFCDMMIGLLSSSCEVHH